MALALLFTVVLPYLNQRWQANAYALSAADSQVIAKPNAAMAADLQLNSKQQVYNFNAQFSPAEGVAQHKVESGGAQIQATLPQDPGKGVTVTDPYNQVSLTLTPKFQALPAQQNQNQVEYPILLGNGALVYTAEAGGVKEDILLRHSIGNKISFSYKLGLGSQFAARLEGNGAVGIYGSSLPLNGSISTGNAKDAALLAKARAKAPKDKLLFSFPAPVIHEANGRQSSAQANFSLKGDSLTVTATGLNEAAYPLSIDPSISVATVTDFFRDTNIETNADFDGANNLIKRGPVNGGDINSWAATTASLGSASLAQSRFLAGTTIYNGYAFVVGGAAAGTTSNYTGASYVEYAQVSPTTAGTLSSGWTNGNSTGLPAGGLSRFKLIAYDGYLYAVDGSTTDTTCTTDSSTIYYATIQVNGILSNWQSLTGPTTARCSLGAAVYNGYMYVVGGKTGAANTTATNTAYYAQILPNGTFGTWTATTNLTTATYGGDLQAYNNYLYYVGGDQNGTVVGSVFYAAINSSTGAIYSTAWIATNSFNNDGTAARENLGSGMTAINDGYIYISGGCSVLNISQSCTTIQNTTRLAQINADGSLGVWSANSGGSTLSLVGANLVSWEGSLYNMAGCSAMNSGAVQCTTALATQQYAAIKSAGNAGGIKTASNTLPTASFAAGETVVNGYLYIIGGCIANGCQPGLTTSVTGSTYYSQIGSDGSLGTWSTAAATITGGIAAEAVTSANGYIYVFGGYTTGTGNAGMTKIYIGQPASTGGIASWTTSGTATHDTAYGLTATYFNGNVYTFGGCSSATSTYGCSTWYTTAWKYSVSGTTVTSVGAVTSLTATTPQAFSALAYYDGYIYLCGGENSSFRQTNKCAYIQLNSNGTLGSSWSMTSGTFNEALEMGAAAGSNGYLYVYGGSDSGGTNFITDVNIGKINPSTGDVSSYSLSGTSITGRWGITGYFNNGFLYATGGCTSGGLLGNCSSISAATEYFQIFNASSLGAKSITTNANNLPSGGTGTGVAATIYNGYLYAAGGCGSYQFGNQRCPNGSVNSGINYAPVNPDGSIGTFTAGPALPAGVFYGRLEAVNGNLYLMGGSNGGNSGSSSVYRSVIGSAGAPAAWTTETTTLPSGEQGLATAVFDGVIYAAGGVSGNTYSSAVWHSTINGSGDISAWTADTSFTNSRAFLGMAAIGGYLYIMGGVNGSTYYSDTQYIQITPGGGTTGSWSYSSDLPMAMAQFGYTAAYGYIYVYTGSNGTAGTSNCLSATYIAPVNSNGTIGAWKQGAGTAFTALTGGAAAYYNGYYYFMGGDACSNGSGSSAIAYSGEQSEAIKAVFSRYIDLVGNGIPRQLLATGSNAAISSTDIEKWRFRYLAGLNSGTIAWGNTSTINPIPFGTLTSNLTALSTTGTDNGVSEWWFFIFDIDQTQTFDFTDGSQPTITGYQWYYAPGTTTRLRNGQQFQDQIHQSLDAHP